MTTLTFAMNLDRATSPGSTAGRDLPGEGFLVLWHRAGNAWRRVREVIGAIDAGPTTIAGRQVRHGVELDLKWARDGEGLLLYAWHGPTGLERLTADQARERAAAGDVLLIEELLASPEAARLILMVELKVGEGPAEDAIRSFNKLVQQHGLSQQCFLAAGALPLLDAARAAAPELARLLFCSHIFKRGAFVHLPLGQLARGLRRGLIVEPQDASVDALCRVGMFPRKAAWHLACARRADRGGLRYLPGRVIRPEALVDLAEQGARGAFAYFAPSQLSRAYRRPGAAPACP
ncbi:MAG: hypothetical protein ACYS22_12630 [Planctomycetota bacterium]|jgi:hypothetical protein